MTVNITKAVLIQRLARIGVRMVSSDRYSVVDVGDFIHACGEEFSLIEEEVRTLTFLIFTTVAEELNEKGKI